MSPLFIALFVFAVFMLAGGWVLFGHRGRTTKGKGFLEDTSGKVWKVYPIDDLLNRPSRVRKMKRRLAKRRATKRRELETMGAALSAAMNDLPERERLVISLYLFEGLTHAEVGEVLSAPGSDVSHIQSRAVDMFLANLKDRLSLQDGARS